MIESKDIQRPKLSKVLLIGDSCIDQYHYGTCDRISPEAPVPILKVLRTEEKGGMALNVKANLEGLDIEVCLLTNSKKIIKSRHIDIRSRQHLLRVDCGEEKRVEALNCHDIDKLDFNSFDVIIISDYDKGFIDDKSIREILSRSKNKKVFVDSKKTDLSSYENCVIKINSAEADAVIKFPAKYDLIRTQGERGALYRGKRFPTKRVELFDVSGAGDTFLAALIYGFLVNQDMSSSIRFANFCSGIVVQKFGTYALKKSDIKWVWKS